MADDELLERGEDGVVVLTLNRPARLNALTLDLAARLRSRLSAINRDPDVRAVILTGAGAGFSSGHDLKNAVAGGEPWVDQILRDSYNNLILAIRANAKPVVAAVNGVAAGAGASLALACDIVVAARSARFIQAFAQIGIAPDAGSSSLMVQALGAPRARALTLLAEPLPAERAAEWGLIWSCVDDDALQAEAAAIARRLAAMPPLGQAFCKRALNAAETNALAAQLDLEAEIQTVASGTADHQEAIRAFTAKRAPTFQGR